MGRFFQAQEVELSKDHIYQPPVELMAKVIENADTQIQANETALLSLYDKLQAEGLKVDEPRLQEIIKGYQSSIDNMATELQQDPLGFRKRMASIKQLSRDISNDWSKGEVAKIQGNKQARDNYQKLLDERVKQGKIMQEDANKALQLFDSKYTGIGYEGPNKYNTYQTENLNDYINAMDVADNIGKGWQADLKAEGYQYDDGQWIRSVNGSTEKVDFNEVKNAVEKGLLADKELMGYYEQQVKLGFMTPQEVSKKLSDVTNVDANKYSYTKTKEETGMDANSNHWEQLKWNKAAEAEKAAALAETSKDASDDYSYAVAVRHFEQDYLNELKKGLTFGSKVKLNSIDDFIAVLNNPATKITPFILKKLAEAQQIQGMVKNSMKASYAGYYSIPGMTEETVDKIRKGHNEHLLANGQSYKFRMPPMEVINKDGSRQTFNYKDGYQEFTPKNMVGKNVRTPDGRLVQIKNVSPVENSVIPILLNGVHNNKSINDNGAHATLKFTVFDPKTGKEETFTRTAYYNMAESEGLSTK